MAEKNNANIGFEKQIWDAACVLWGHIPAAEYRKVIIGLIFLRYISSAFERKYNELVTEGEGFEEDRDEYLGENIFFVPEKARWSTVAAAAHTPEIGTVLDEAMREIEAENKSLKNVLPKNYASPDLDKRVLGDVVDLFTNMDKYDKEKFLSEVFMTESKYDRLVAVLQKKKNIILQGAPGVGKTFAAKRLAYSIMGEKDDDRVEFVQFHQNYSYEDFMMGYKPVEDGFELKYGIFYRFCQKAANHPNKDYFFIIDEINRGNMSKIFGELLMLIEADYRDKKATLAYNGLGFSVPKRLHIIGMMNTADRSLAMIDYALRRRFSFFDMDPGFDSEGFKKYQDALANDTFNTLIDKIQELNREIKQDKSLGKGFCIGHSYFCNAEECTDEWMKDVVDFDILPMLNEYWFDDANKVQRWENLLKGVFQ